MGKKKVYPWSNHSWPRRKGQIKQTWATGTLFLCVEEAVLMEGGQSEMGEEHRMFLIHQGTLEHTKRWAQNPLNPVFLLKERDIELAYLGEMMSEVGDFMKS